MTSARAPGSAGLSDIEHVLILMLGSRSFDHYFGTLSGVRGMPGQEATPARPAVPS
jgi:phospholipase C